jgi:hypothetical protein
MAAPSPPIVLPALHETPTAAPAISLSRTICYEVRSIRGGLVCLDPAFMRFDAHEGMQF